MTNARPRILALANQKGGVGKTTTAINLGTALASIKERVLLVDLDPQGNASTGLGIPNSMQARSPSTLEVMTGEASVAQAARQTEVSGLSIIPATSDLLVVEQAAREKRLSNFALRDALHGYGAEQAGADIAPSYVLIDCPPSLSFLTLSALCAADAVIIPLQCEFFAMEGLGLLVDTIEQVRDNLNHNLIIQGVILTMHDGRQALTQQVEDDVRNYLRDKVYVNTVPRNVRLSEAPSFGQPALIYDMNCKGSRAYIEVAKELIRRERGLAAA